MNPSPRLSEASNTWSIEAKCGTQTRFRQLLTHSNRYHKPDTLSYSLRLLFLQGNVRSPSLSRDAPSLLLLQHQRFMVKWLPPLMRRDRPDLYCTMTSTCTKRAAFHVQGPIIFIKEALTVSPLRKEAFSTTSTHTHAKTSSIGRSSNVSMSLRVTGAWSELVDHFSW